MSLKVNLQYFRITQHLRPLAIAVNVVQAAFCRIDQVLLTFGYLTMNYKTMMANDPDNIEGPTAIISSIEKRWGKADQEVFISAVILNPLYQSRPFGMLSFLNFAGISNLLKQLWERVFSGDDVPREFYSNLTDYFAENGMFLGLDLQCRIEKNNAQDDVRESASYDIFLRTNI